VALNPNISQGNLQRLAAAVQVLNYPGLNITASYLGRDGIRYGLEGNANTRIPTMTGLINSPEPYQVITCVAHLLKPQPLALAWQQQYAMNALIGPFTVYPDVDVTQGGIGPYSTANGSIYGLREMSFNGESDAWMLILTGYVVINQQMWQST
jgi:hypothetical protein